MIWFCFSGGCCFVTLFISFQFYLEILCINFILFLGVSLSRHPFSPQSFYLELFSHTCSLVHGAQLSPHSSLLVLLALIHSSVCYIVCLPAILFAFPLHTILVWFFVIFAFLWLNEIPHFVVIHPHVQTASMGFYTIKFCNIKFYLRFCKIHWVFIICSAS